jgi:hypothetical protein
MAEGLLQLPGGLSGEAFLLVDDDTRFKETFTQALQRALAADLLDVTFIEAGSVEGNGATSRIPTFVLTVYLDHAVTARAMDASALYKRSPLPLATPSPASTRPARMRPVGSPTAAFVPPPLGKCCLAWC